MSEVIEICDARTVWWPDVEACDVTCIKSMDHEGAHEDEIFGEWEEDE